MAFPVFVDKGAFNAYSSQATNDVAFPATVNANDILVILILAFGNRTATTPTNWNAIVSIQDTRSVIAFWKRASGSESGNETVTLSSSVNSTSIMMRFSGAITTGTPYESLVDGGHVNVNTMDTGELTTTGIERLATAIHVIATNVTPSTPSNYSLEFNEVQGSFSTSMNLWTQEKATAGTVNAETSTTVSASDRFMITFALIPVTGGDDNLTSTDIETGNSEVIASSLGQIHIIVSDNVETNNSEVISGSLGQIHVLSSLDIESQNVTISNPVLSEDVNTDNLTSTNIESANVIIVSAILTQIHVLTSSDIETSNVIIENASISQTQILLSSDIESQNVIITNATIGAYIELFGYILKQIKNKANYNLTQTQIDNFQNKL